MNNTGTVRFTGQVWGASGWEWMCDGIANNHPETGWGETEETATTDFYSQCTRYAARLTPARGTES